MFLNRRIGKLVWLLLGSFLAGCNGAPAIILPASGSAKAITELLWIVFGVSLVVFLLIEGMLFFVVFKFRSKKGQNDGFNPSHANRG